MADLVEALHNLARQRGRDNASPLIGLRQIAEREGGRISHLPISQRLEQAWVKLTGQPFRQHQSLALSAVRRGEPFALVGGGTHARQTLCLLTLEVLRAEPQASAILLTPDDDSLDLYLGELERMSQALAQPVPVGAASAERARRSLGARAVLATPAGLHDRLLRRHDRAWSALWSRLRLLVVADAHRYDGLAASHLSALLLRAGRLAPASPPLQLAASVAEVSGADAALTNISGLNWRLIAADDAPRPGVALGLWRAGADRQRELVALALGMQRAGASVHITCAGLEVAPLRALIGADVAAVSVAAAVLPAHVQIVAGVGAGGAALREAIDSGASLVLLLLGDDPAERTIARVAARGDGPIPLIDGPPPVWPAAPLNAYVAAQHLLCAASERPISGAELERWGYESIADRLEARGELVRLPDAEPLWQPRAGGHDPYFELGLRAAGVLAVAARDEQGAALGPLDPAAFDRWAFRGAALPPLRGGLRVVSRDEELLTLTLRPGGELRRTMPLRRCTARVRDTRERRTLRGRDVGWGRVIVGEEIYGYRELVPGNAVAERALSSALSTEWSAPALWIDLPAPVSPAGGQLVGWSLVAALPLLALGELGDLVPVYDAEARRLIFVDANPGGNGLSAWLYDHLDEVLPLAYDVALDCGGDPLLEPVARADKDWLLGLLSGRQGEPRRQPAREPAPLAYVAPSPAREPRREEPPVARREQPAREEPPLPPRREPPLPPPRREALPAREELWREPLAREEPPLPPRREPPLREEPPPAREEPPLREEPPGARREPVREEPPLSRPAPAPAQPALPLEPEPAGEREPAPPKRRRERESARSGERRKATPKREEPPAERRKATPKQEERPAAPARPAEQGRAAPPPREEQPAPAPRRAPEPAPPAAEPEPVLPDAAAMVARLRRLREQRERRDPPSPPARRPAPAAGEGEPRFRPGDRVHCTPYGEGEVRSSRLDGDRELLVVEFPDHGELTVDAAVSAARLVAAADEPEPDF